MLTANICGAFLIWASGLSCAHHSPLFQLAGGAVLAVGVWTLAEKSDYISLLNSGFYSASAYILIAAGGIVIVTGIIGCCATLKEMKSLLIVVKMDLKHLKEICSFTSVVSFDSNKA